MAVSSCNSSVTNSRGRNPVQYDGVTECHVDVPSCPNFPDVEGYDIIDDYEGSGSDQGRCLQRAQDYYDWCASEAPVNARFLIDGSVVAESTYPTCGDNMCSRGEGCDTCPSDCAPCGGTNLIEDPGFENAEPRDLVGESRPWLGEEPGDGRIVYDPATAHTGNQYARFTGFSCQLMQKIDVTPYTSYRVSAWIAGTPGVDQHLSDGLGGFFVAPYVEKADGDYIPDGDGGFDGPPYWKAIPLQTGTGSWGAISFTFNSGPATAMSINFDQTTQPDAILMFDDVSVFQEDGELPNPSLWGSTSDSQVMLQWSPYPGADRYVVWRADLTADEFPRIIAEVTDGSNQFVDDNLINGRYYSYQIAVEPDSEVWIFSYDKLFFVVGSP
jgi:hypothetical protein